MIPHLVYYQLASQEQTPDNGTCYIIRCLLLEGLTAVGRAQPGAGRRV
jgi:hypothetical protein